MFDPKSRYAQLPTYQVIDRRGRAVAVVPAAEKPVQGDRGRHLHKQGERVDHLASHYLDDAAGSWRIWEHNDAMLPEALTEALEISVPTKTTG